MSSLRVRFTGTVGQWGKEMVADKSGKKQARHFPVPVWSVNPDRACSGSECLPRETCLVPALLGTEEEPVTCYVCCGQIVENMKF